MHHTPNTPPIPSQLTQELTPLTHQIQRYQPGIIVINDVQYQHAVILQETQPITPWSVEYMAQINLSKLQTLCTSSDTLLIIGSGAAHHTLDLKLIAQSQLAIECMSTRAACHTYTILAQDHRAVIAALLL